MYEFNVDKFAAAIELWIQFSDITNAEFAELTGMGVSTLYNLKNASLAPNMAQFTNVCNLLEMPPETFFKKKVKGK